MELLEDGLRSLARNFTTLLLGMALVLLTSGAYFFSSAAAIEHLYPELLTFIAQVNPAPGESSTANTAEIVNAPTLAPPPVAYVLLNIVSEVVFAIFISIIYAIVFARFGRAIDRPLWKCASDREAAHRFFMPWFILTLTTIALRDLQAHVDSVDLMLAIELFLIVLGPFILPIGACVMHYGALEWEHIGQILSPIGRQFRLILPILLLGLFEYVLQESLAAKLPTGAEAVYRRAAGATLLNAPVWILDALLFCMMWRVCMLDRDSGPHDHDDFD